MTAAALIPDHAPRRPRPEARHYAVAVGLVVVAAIARWLLASIFGQQLSRTAVEGPMSDFGEYVTQPERKGR